MPGYDVFMKVETVDGEPKADDRFAIDWANEVALGGPDTAPDGGDWANQVASGGDRATTASTVSPPGEDVMCSNNLLIGAEGDNFLVIDWLAADQASTNPSNDLPPMETLRSVDTWDPSAGLLPMESLTPVDTAGALVGDDSCPILSDAIVPNDFFLI
jgi:hypothetical protein